MAHIEDTERFQAVLALRESESRFLNAKEREESIMRFYQMPKVLIEESKFNMLSVEARFLYMLFLDLMQLSKKNCWRDPDGIYIYYSQARMAVEIHRSLPTVRKRLKELIDIGLIVRKRRGLTLCDKIYVQIATLFPSGEEPDFLSERQPASCPEAKIDHPNDTKGSTPDLSTREIILPLPGTPAAEPVNSSLKPKNTNPPPKTPFEDKYYNLLSAEALADCDWNRELSIANIKKELAKLSHPEPIAYGQ